MTMRSHNHTKATRPYGVIEIIGSFELEACPLRNDSLCQNSRYGRCACGLINSHIWHCNFGGIERFSALRTSKPIPITSRNIRAREAMNKFVAKPDCWCASQSDETPFLLRLLT